MAENAPRAGESASGRAGAPAGRGFSPGPGFGPVSRGRRWLRHPFGRPRRGPYPPPGEPFHIIDPEPFHRSFLDEICALATEVRAVAKSRDGRLGLHALLGDRRAMLYFTQPSTRTFLSFNNACHILGIRTSEIRDPSTSSEVKGESLEDSIRTFSSYVDVIIMRSGEPGLAARAAHMMDSIRAPGADRQRG